MTYLSTTESTTPFNSFVIDKLHGRWLGKWPNGGASEYFRCQVYLIPDLFVNEMALIGIFNKVHDVLETRIDASIIYVLSISLAN